MVLDTSATLEVLLQTPLGISFQTQWKTQTEFHSPCLLDLEIAQVLRKLIIRNLLDSNRANDALKDYLNLPILKYTHDSLLGRIWELRENTTSYDAAYLALAEALEMPLLTADKKLAGISGHRAEVRVLK